MNPEIMATFNNYPNDIQIEYALLGYIIIDNSLMPKIGFLRPEDFYSSPHMEIFQVMVNLFSDGKDITPFTIQPLLKQDRLNSFPEGIMHYLANAAIAAHVEIRPVEMAKYLQKLSDKRRLIVACEDVIFSANQDQQTAEECAVTLANIVEKITVNSPLNDFQDDYQVGEEIISDLKDNRMPYSTGLTKLDDAMGGGLYPGRAYGFAAKKKVGKTVLAGTISANLNQQGIRHLFICGEMSPKEIQQRNLARATDSFPSSFRTEYGKNYNFQKKIAEAVNNSPRNMLYRNAPGLTFQELRRVCSSAVDRHGVKGIILDYWQLVGGKQKNQSDASHLDDVAQWIADFSRKHSTWFIMMAQINQEGNTRGGEGIRLAFDQVYHMKAPGDDPSRSGRYLDMMDTRYTKWTNIGTENQPGISMNEKGPFFEHAESGKW